LRASRVFPTTSSSTVSDNQLRFARAKEKKREEEEEEEEEAANDDDKVDAKNDVMMCVRARSSFLFL